MYVLSCVLFRHCQDSTSLSYWVPGDTDLGRGYGDVRPWRSPFYASPVVRKGSISSKRVSSQDPLLRKFWNFSLYSLNFHPNFSSQAPKVGTFQLTSPLFGNFQLTSPQIWKFSAHKPPNLKIFSSQTPKFLKFSAHKPPFSEANVSSQAPYFGNPGRTPLPEKKSACPPRYWVSTELFIDHLAGRWES